MSESAVSSSYTNIVAYNRDRNSTKVATLLCGVIPTSSYIATLGTPMEAEYFGSGSAVTKIGGQSNSRNEWILKQNRTYLISYLSTGAANITYNVNWYEEGR